MERNRKTIRKILQIELLESLREGIVRYRLLTILCLGILDTSTASAQIMECIHADGRKEFAQTCPAGTVNQKQMAGKSATRPIDNATETGSSAQKSTNQLEIEFQQRRIAREQAEEKQEREQKAKQERCAALRQRLSMYQTSNFIKKYDQATGKWNYVEDDQRSATIAQIQSELGQCN